MFTSLTISQVFQLQDHHPWEKLLHMFNSYKQRVWEFSFWKYMYMYLVYKYHSANPLLRVLVYVYIFITIIYKY